MTEAELARAAAWAKTFCVKCHQRIGVHKIRADDTLACPRVLR